MHFDVKIVSTEVQTHSEDTIPQEDSTLPETEPHCLQRVKDESWNRRKNRGSFKNSNRD